MWPAFYTPPGQKFSIFRKNGYSGRSMPLERRTVLFKGVALCQPAEKPAGVVDRHPAGNAYSRKLPNCSATFQQPPAGQVTGAALRSL